MILSFLLICADLWGCILCVGVILWAPHVCKWKWTLHISNRFLYNGVKMCLVCPLPPARSSKSIYEVMIQWLGHVKISSLSHTHSVTLGSPEIYSKGSLTRVHGSKGKSNQVEEHNCVKDSGAPTLMRYGAKNNKNKDGLSVSFFLLSFCLLLLFIQPLTDKRNCITEIPQAKICISSH